MPEFRLDFSFQRGWDKESDFGELLERQFERDRALTYTASGPHKADFRIRAEGVPVEDILAQSAEIINVRSAFGAGRIPYPPERPALSVSYR